MFIPKISHMNYTHIIPHLYKVKHI